MSDRSKCGPQRALSNGVRFEGLSSGFVSQKALWVKLLTLIAIFTLKATPQTPWPPTKGVQNRRKYLKTCFIYRGRTKNYTPVCITLRTTPPKNQNLSIEACTGSKDG